MIWSAYSPSFARSGPTNVISMSEFTVPAEIAAGQVKADMSDMEKGRAMYDYTFSTMRYDKSGTGWGKGDTLWACDAKRGNCTDFHSVFISMARSQHLPAKFEIGIGHRV